MALESRRQFNQKLLGSLVAYGLIDTLFRRELLADSVKPVVTRWMAELNTLSQDLKDQKLKDIDFQAKLEDLYRQVDLPELLKLLEFDKLTKNVRLPDNGARSIGLDLAKVEGLPKKLAFGRQIFALKKGRSIVPHGHDNMSTGFVVLGGTFAGKHYDRVEDHDDHYLIKPTIDRAFGPAEFSTISDHKDNVHWFKCTSEAGYVFNIHVMGYNKENPKVSSRVYVDPEGEKVSGGLIIAKKMTSSECHKKYG